MSFELNIRLDPASLDTLYGFNNYQSVLEPALLRAMDTGISMLQAKASDYMWSVFENPTGKAEDDSWDVQITGPYEAILGNTALYSQRLNYGFSGMADSLGRHFDEWPIGEYAQGYHWAEQTIILSQYKIQDVFQAAIDYSNSQLAGGSTP